MLSAVCGDWSDSQWAGGPQLTGSSYVASERASSQRRARRPKSCPVRTQLHHCVPFENNMSRLTSKAVLRCAVIIILLGILMVLVALTNPFAISMATATLLIGVLMIALASFAGL